MIGAYNVLVPQDLRPSLLIHNVNVTYDVTDISRYKYRLSADLLHKV